MNGTVYVRGQIFAAGVRLALAAALVVGGFHLVFGENVLRSAGYVIGTFAGVTVLSWMAELFLGSAFERVTAERATQYRQEYEPVGGAAFESARPLLGGPNAPETLAAFAAAGSTSGLKGRALDLTLPEERAILPAPNPISAVRQVAADVATSHDLPTPASALPASDADNDFQDLGSLLRSPVSSAREAAATTATAAAPAAPPAGTAR